MRWVRRNEDKPHRCPECHCVALWRKSNYDARGAVFGPRSRLSCPFCRVQWRMGVRETREGRVCWKRRDSGGMLPYPENRYGFVPWSMQGRRRRGGKPS